MNCKKCGTPLLDNDKFCSECGEPREVVVEEQEPVMKQEVVEEPVPTKEEVKEEVKEEMKKEEKKEKKVNPIVAIIIALVAFAIGYFGYKYLIAGKETPNTKNTEKETTKETTKETDTPKEAEAAGDLADNIHIEDDGVYVDTFVNVALDEINE